MTAAFAEARRVCIRNHVVVEGACWFSGFGRDCWFIGNTTEYVRTRMAVMLQVEAK
jgi:hypothetical protein